jgi:2-polyprenyl-3-methyl-5-hydroxy-6-metoxy-1,4-benzoquinol methylase
VRWFLPVILIFAACTRHEPVVEEDPRAEAAYREYRRPDLIVAGLDLHRREKVLDVGAGRGFLTVPVARAAGSVKAIDIDGKALAELSRRAAAAGVTVETAVVERDDPMLDDGERFDRILLSEVDHLLPDRAAYLAKLRLHLADGGTIAVSNKRYDREPLVAAARAAGLVQRSEVTTLPAHFLLLFGVAP